MFKKKYIKINKKKYCNKKILNKLLIKNNNILLLKNKKNFIYKNIIFINKNNKLIKGNKNICSIIGKYKTIFNFLKISRHTIHNLASTSNLPNFSKISW